MELEKALNLQKEFANNLEKIVLDFIYKTTGLTENDIKKQGKKLKLYMNTDMLSKIDDLTFKINMLDIVEKLEYKGETYLFREYYINEKINQILK